jgi:hypothetical protein
VTTLPRFVWLLLAGLLLSACAAQPPNHHLRERFEQLIEKARMNGPIFVIINARVPPWEPPEVLETRGPGLAEAQSSAIREKQLSILRAIDVAPDDPRVRLYMIGGISVRVEAHQLSLLRDHPDVAHIEEPVILRNN